MSWSAVRRFVIFALGVGVVIEALTNTNDNQVADLIIGLVMIGVLPLDDLLRAYGQRRGPPNLGDS